MARQAVPPDYPPAAEPKSRRKPASLALKITAGQASRILRAFLKIDLLVILLFSLLLLFERGNAARFLVEQYPVSAAAMASRMPGVRAETVDDSGFGILYDPWVEDLLDLPQGAVYSLAWEDAPEDPFLWSIGVRPLFRMAIPTGDGVWTRFTFDLGDSLRRLCYGMLAVLAVQFLMLLGLSGSTRRSVRRTLAPIGQLAATTQSMSAEPSRRPGPRPERLELSGTIDTLNNITAGRLDTRIDTAHERPELRGLAEAINGMLDRLDEAYSSQLRFVSDASHELRTPIAVLQGYANLLDRWGKDDPAALQESIDAIKAEAESMKKLVEQLLFLARSDNNTVEMQVRPLDVAGVATEVLRDTRLIDREHEFVAGIDPGLWVNGDAALLKQALRVLVENAVKYTPAGGRITISARRADGRVCVSVADSGIGIPEEELPRLFERFYRSDESRARATGGTGLGLSIAKWIVQRHNGDLEVLSRKDIGTRFTLVLPDAALRAQSGEATG